MFNRPLMTLLLCAAGATVLGVSGCQAAGSAAHHAVTPAPGSQSSTRSDSPAPAAGAASNAPAAAGHVISACALVTEQQAGTALGTASGAGTSTPSRSPHYSQCNYDSGALIVTVNDLGKSLYDKTHASIKLHAPAGAWSEVSGLGNAAFESHAGPSAYVTFYAGTTFVSIILTRTAPPAPTAAAITLAKSAAARL